VFAGIRWLLNVLDVLHDPVRQFLGFIVDFAALAIMLLPWRRKQVWVDAFNFAPCWMVDGAKQAQAPTQ
jgi:hypothetical protein